MTATGSAVRLWRDRFVSFLLVLAVLAFEAVVWRNPALLAQRTRPRLALQPAAPAAGRVAAERLLTIVTQEAVQQAVLRQAPTVDALTEVFQRIRYDLAKVRNGKRDVPRLFVALLPSDIAAVKDAAGRKALFIRLVLPLLLVENQRILGERRLLKTIVERAGGGPIGRKDSAWLRNLAQRYRVGETLDADGRLPASALKALLLRVDAVPPSLALAQSAEESGWGTSRFARQGNALFGQRTWRQAAGIVPKQRDAGAAHKVRSFVRLAESVQAYLETINIGRHYGGLRRARAAARAEGGRASGKVLAGHLLRYSERGLVYVENLRTIIRVNRLDEFDDVRLGDVS